VGFREYISPGKVEEILVYSEAKLEFGTPPCDFSMHADMKERFDRIEAKYGMLSETLMGFMQEFGSFNARLDEHNRKLDIILEKLVLLEERKA